MKYMDQPLSGIRLNELSSALRCEEEPRYMTMNLEVPVPKNGLPPLSYDTEEWAGDHYAVLARYRELDPVHPQQIEDSLTKRSYTLWRLFRYDDVAAALKDTRLVRELNTVFPSQNSAVAEKWPNLQESWANWMLLRDPPDHTRLRTLVSKAFTPRMVENLRSRIEHITDELLLAYSPGFEVDVVPGFAFALPVIVIAEMLGVPAEDRVLFREWSRPIARALGPVAEGDLIEADGATQEMRAYLRDIVRDRQRFPRPDLISGLITARDENGRLTETELVDNCILLLVAGHETTVNLIANGLWLLTTHPDQLAQLRRDPSMYPGLVEEVLRFEPSVQSTARIAAEDLVIGNRTIRKGDEISLWLAAANRDPAQFAEPDEFRIARQPNRPLTFGGGIHHCLGAPLARLEGAVAMQKFVERFPDFAWADTKAAWQPDIVFRTLRELKVRI